VKPGSVLVASAFLLGSCGGAVTPAPGRITPRPPPTPVAQETEPARDASPVPEPDSLVLRGRIRPSAAPILGVLGPPFSRLAERPVQAIAPWLPTDLDELAALDAPIDFALALSTPETLIGRGPDFAVSIGLSSLGAALARLRRANDVLVSPRGAGVWKARFAESDEECWVLAAAGTVPARLVCGTSAAALEVLAAYLARGVETRLGADQPMVVDAWPARFAAKHHDALARSLRYFLPFATRQDRALSRVERALGTVLDDGLELAADTDALHVTAVEDHGGLALTLRAEMSGKRSWLGRTLRSYAKRGNAANRLFARLPADSELAFFSSGPDAARSDEARALAVTWLADLFGPGVQRGTLRHMVDASLQKAPYAYAEGDAYGRDSQGEFTGRRIWEKTLATFGWHILAIDEPLKELVVELDGGMKAYNSGDLHDLAYRELARLCPGLTKITRQPARAKGLPRGSLLYEMKLPGKFFDDCAAHWGRQGRDKAPSESLAVLAVPVGEQTLIGFAPQPAELAKRMAALVKPAPDTTLDSLAELEPLVNGPAVLGGFVSLAGVGGLIRFLTMQEPWEWRRSALAALPSRGRSRVPFQLRIVPDEPLAAELQLTFGSAALQELAALSQPRLRY
jgi:hypothetical protein